ncbi:MAG: YibE/F family protein [Patescibacteria group bacterium]
MFIRSKTITCFIIFGALCFIQTVSAQEPVMNYIRARVQEVSEVHTEGEYPLQQAQVRLLNGPNEGTIIDVTNEQTANREDLRIVSGQTVILQNLARPDGSEVYYFQETFRLNHLFWVFCAFLILVTMIGKKRGLMSLFGLIVSISIIIFIIFPLIKAGWNAFGVSIVGTFLIACSTILIAHGYNKRALLALLSTCITLVCAIVIAFVTVDLVSLFGLGSEESVFLKLDPTLHIDPKGLLLAGIIIGALGVLDDITTSQVAAVDEVRKANPAYDFKQLYKSGLSVGHEHIASMINTLALAYIGASLPMFMLFTLGGGAPAWVTLNSAFLTEEIIRTLVGSSALLLATPISTFFAARSFAR